MKVTIIANNKRFFSLKSDSYSFGLVFSLVQLNQYKKYYDTLDNHLFNNCINCCHPWIWWISCWSCGYCKNHFLYFHCFVCNKPNQKVNDLNSKLKYE